MRDRAVCLDGLVHEVVVVHFAGLAGGQSPFTGQLPCCCLAVDPVTGKLTIPTTGRGMMQHCMPPADDGLTCLDCIAGPAVGDAVIEVTVTLS